MIRVVGSVRACSGPATLLDLSMTDRWADYLISHVRYQDAQVLKVLAWEDQGHAIAGGRQLNRKQVLELLGEGNTVLTIHRVEDDPKSWRPEAFVRIVSVDGTDYIRTDAVAAQQDHLGKLAGF